MKKFILIDAANREVREVELEEGLGAIYAAMDVRMIEVGTYLSNDDCVYVDEEGLLSLDAETMFFDIGAHQPFAGNGLVVGTNNDTGETVSALSTVEDIRAKVKFLTLAEVRRMF